jgi:predicted TIM-barrel fold metal-dependent hydrolase
MKVFDVHVHVQPWRMLRPGALALMDDEAHRGAAAILEDPGALIAHLDREGVSRICCINYVSPAVMGFGREVNDWIADFTEMHRDRLLPVGSVNPLFEARPDEEIARVLDLGMRMIKIHPPHQLFSPNAYRTDGLKGLASIYEECQARGVPVMFHTGTSVFPGARNVYADPMPVDDVAIDYPELTIILAHAGRPLYGETAYFLARRHPNVHVDLSGIPPAALRKYVPRLESIADKVLWGTDWPSPGVVSMKSNVEAFRRSEYPEAVVEKVLWANAARIFDRG